MIDDNRRLFILTVLIHRRILGFKVLQKDGGHKIVPREDEDTGKHYRFGGGPTDTGRHSRRVVAFVTADPHHDEPKDQSLVETGEDVVTAHIVNDAVKEGTIGRAQEFDADRPSSPYPNKVE